MRRFYYSAIRDGKECDGIVRANSIDSAREQLIRDGYEEITLSMLSSLGPDIDQDKPISGQDPLQPPS